MENINKNQETYRQKLFFHPFSPIGSSTPSWQAFLYNTNKAKQKPLKPRQRVVQRFHPASGFTLAMQPFRSFNATWPGGSILLRENEPSKTKDRVPHTLNTSPKKKQQTIYSYIIAIQGMAAINISASPRKNNSIWLPCQTKTPTPAASFKAWPSETASSNSWWFEMWRLLLEAKTAMEDVLGGAMFLVVLLQLYGRFVLAWSCYFLVTFFFHMVIALKWSSFLWCCFMFPYGKQHTNWLTSEQQAYIVWIPFNMDLRPSQQIPTQQRHFSTSLHLSPFNRCLPRSDFFSRFFLSCQSFLRALSTCSRAVLAFNSACAKLNKADEAWSGRKQNTTSCLIGWLE